MPVVAGSVLMASQAFGAFTSAQLIEVTTLSVTDFETANPDHALHFTGYKAWKSGEEARVKIYVNHDGHAMEFNYSCHNHDGEFECHAN